jgi:branched-chain amino acid transport system permease protein
VIVHLIGRDMFIAVLATFGIAIVLQQLMARLFGAGDRIVDSGLSSWFLFDGLVGISQVKVLVFVCCVAFGAGLVAGKVVRAGKAKDPLTDPDMGRLFLGG